MRKLFRLLVICLVLVVLVFAVRRFYTSATIHELLTENKHLKESISNLTAEDQIGYAKVLEQNIEAGKLYTTLLFVETARDDKLKKLLEKQYTIEGDIIHFDALIVKFTDQLVMDGKERSMYLWRRVYGENQSPGEGFAIEEAGVESKRYANILGKLPAVEKQLFWSSIWDLANDPEKLQQYGVKAIYGNAVYSKLRKNLIYVFKIGPTGQLYPEIVPDI
ncbi:MAG: hypothetical protein PHF37_07100 [Phycisphaerae bacterium]|nr:hypothetical protein [Phycisphaerae bacterium]